jgi:hypothetical protein
MLLLIIIITVWCARRSRGCVAQAVARARVRTSGSLQRINVMHASTGLEDLGFISATAQFQNPDGTQQEQLIRWSQGIRRFITVFMQAKAVQAISRTYIINAILISAPKPLLSRLSNQYVPRKCLHIHLSASLTSHDLVTHTKWTVYTVKLFTLNFSSLWGHFPSAGSYQVLQKWFRLSGGTIVWYIGSQSVYSDEEGKKQGQINKKDGKKL